MTVSTVARRVMEFDALRAPKQAGSMRRLSILLRLNTACCILSCCCVAPCYSADGFLSRELRVAGRIQSITIGDFNGDSRPDIAVRTLDDLSVLLNVGGGDFSSPKRTALPYGPDTAGVTDYGVARTELAADFNGDGRLDLAIRDRNEILFGVGDGTFLPPQVITGEFPSFYGLTATGDFNGDKKPDLAFFVKGSLAILLGNGDGTFRMGSTAQLGGDGQLMVADFNRDGRSDLAYLRYHYYSTGWDPNCCVVQVYLGQNDGTFKDTVPISGIVAGGLLAADLNNDGIPDIAAVNAVLQGNGAGSFQRIPRLPFASADLNIFYATPSGPFAAADLDGDAHVDLVEFVTDNTEGRWVFSRVGRGDGTFGEAGGPFHPDLSLADWRIGIADLDGDERPDVVAALHCPLAPPGGIAAGYYPFGAGCTDRSNNLKIFLNRIEAAPR